MLFTAGFSCTGRSRLNNTRKDNADGIRLSKDDATSVTWCGVYEYLKRCFPKMVALENVVELDSKSSDDGSSSDAEFIHGKMIEMGYVGTYLQIQANQYGSACSRNRLYFLYFHGPDADAGRVHLLKQTISAIKLDFTIPPNSFLLPETDVAQWVSKLQDEAVNPRRKRKVEKYEDEHCNIFNACGISWPPHCGIFNACGIPGDTFAESLRALSARRVECAIFCEAQWPFDAAALPEDGIEIFDINFSLGRLVGTDGHINPWKNVPGCLTGSGRYWMRHQVMGVRGKPVLVHRLLHGAEVFAFAGFHPKFYGWKAVPDHEDIEESDLLSSFGGNAFSAFAFGAALLGLLAGHAKPGVAAQVPEPDSDEDREGGDSDAS